jgi:hypothetical protein
MTVILDNLVTYSTLSASVSLLSTAGYKTVNPAMLRLRHALPSGTRGLMPHDHSLSLAPPISEPSALLLLSFFLSFRSSYLGLPIDRVLALLLTHHRSTID